MEDAQKLDARRFRCEELVKFSLQGEKSERVKARGRRFRGIGNRFQSTSLERNNGSVFNI